MAKTTPVQKKVRIVPLGDRVLVELIETNKSPGGLTLPEKQCSHGIIRAIGLGVPGELVAGDQENTRDSKLNSRGFRINDVVYLPKGANVGEKFPTDEGTMCLLLPSSHIAAIVEET